jgi:hypothetical protein
MVLSQRKIELAIPEVVKIMLGNESAHQWQRLRNEERLSKAL